MFDLKRTPTHPGEVLREDFLKPLGLTQVELARLLKTTFRTVNEILNGRRSVTPDMAMRLSKLFGTSAELWLNLQNEYDLYRVRQKRGDLLEEITPLKKLRKAVGQT